LAYHFGWSIEYCLDLSPIQFQGIYSGLGEILKQKYDPNYSKEVEFEKQKKLSEIQLKYYMDSKRKKDNKGNGELIKIDLSKLGSLGRK
jgi:hypothetical protein